MSEESLDWYVKGCGMRNLQKLSKFQEMYKVEKMHSAEIARK